MTQGEMFSSTNEKIIMTNLLGAGDTFGHESILAIPNTSVYKCSAIALQDSHMLYIGIESFKELLTEEFHK